MMEGDDADNLGEEGAGSEGVPRNEAERDKQKSRKSVESALGTVHPAPVHLDFLTIEVAFQVSEGEVGRTVT